MHIEKYINCVIAESIFATRTTLYNQYLDQEIEHYLCPKVILIYSPYPIPSCYPVLLKMWSGLV